MNLFGFEIKRKREEEVEKLPAFSPPVEDDGAVVVAAGGVYGTYVDLDGSVRSEAELISRYREMALTPEIDAAVDEVVNEAIVDNGDDPIIKLDLDQVNLSPTIKKRIQEEFDIVLELLDFIRQAYDIFRRWYVDGRLNYHLIVDEKNIVEGIQELRYIDPRKIRKVREVKKKVDPKSQATLTKTEKEYYVYNDKGFNKQSSTTAVNAGTTAGLKIAKDSIIFVPSGLMDKNNTLVLSYLHKAIKPLNQLRALEDATVIYRISRAPERRIFYIDVGNLPKAKAEQYLRDMMVRHKNRVVYDASTGEIKDDRKFMTMLEDYWFPRREGTRGTEIQTLPAGQNLGEMADVKYFQDKLYQALNVPSSRMNTENIFNIGRSAEISRDEVKFYKQILRFRQKFSQLFIKALERQLILKQVMTSDDWATVVPLIKFQYSQDNYYAELKENEIMKERMGVLQMIQGAAGMYYSNKWIRTHILKQTDEEMEQLDNEMLAERDNMLYNPPQPEQSQGQEGNK